ENPGHSPSIGPLAGKNRVSGTHRQRWLHPPLAELVDRPASRRLIADARPRTRRERRVTLRQRRRPFRVATALGSRRAWRGVPEVSATPAAVRGPSHPSACRTESLYVAPPRLRRTTVSTVTGRVRKDWRPMTPFP